MAITLLQQRSAVLLIWLVISWVSSSTHFGAELSSWDGPRDTLFSRKRFLKRRLNFYSNCSATFNPALLRITLSGDIHPNPGPTSTSTTSTSKYLFMNARSIEQRASNRPLKCALLNSRSLKAFCNDPVTGTNTCKLTLFKNLVYSNSYDIIAVTETWLTETVSDGEIIDQGYSIYHRDRQSKRGGGVLLAVRSNIASNRRHDFETDDFETVCVELHPADSNKIFISVVYRPPDADTSFMDKFSELISNLQHIHRSKCVLLGDFNLPNINWINSFGFSNYQHEFEFTECLKENGLFQLNTSSTHFTPLNNEGKILDLIITNEPDIISSIEVHSPTTMDFPTDHWILDFDLTCRLRRLKTSPRIVYNSNYN